MNTKYFSLEIELAKFTSNQIVINKIYLINFNYFWRRNFRIVLCKLM